MIDPKNKWRRYNTPFGICINEKCETVISKYLIPNYRGQIQLIFTSPPFPLNRAKKYGNLNGDEYKKWLCDVVKCHHFLRKNMPTRHRYVFHH